MMLKKAFLIFLLVGICFTTFVSPVGASKGETINSTEMSKQAQIDELFTRLNEVVSEQKHLEKLTTIIPKNTPNNTQITSKIKELKEKKAKIENQIINLGVKKLDPNNNADMELLHELSTSTVQQGGDFTTFSTVPPPPDLESIANLYSLYRYQGTYTYDNVTYNYSYIRVVDNKGYNGLYKFNEYNAAPANATQSTIQAVLGYTFKYVFSNLLSRTPLGLVADWTMGAAIEGMDAYNTTLITSTSDPFYRIFASSTTQMTYYWIYYNNEWKMMGSDGTFSFTRTDFAAFNYQGQPKHLSDTQPTWSSSSGYSWWQYVENFHNNRSNPYYTQHHYFGSFNLSFYQATVTYTPVYYSSPGSLI